MNIQGLKENLHKQIDTMENAEALQVLHDAAVEYNKPDRKDILDHLTEEQKTSLKISLQQAADGNTISHQEAMQLLAQWRKK